MQHYRKHSPTKTEREEWGKSPIFRARRLYFPAIESGSPPLAILRSRDYLKRKKFGGEKDGPAQSRKAQEGKDQFKTTGVLR